MKRASKWLVSGGVAALMCLGICELQAQNRGPGGPGGGPGGPGGDRGRGGFDPAAMQQRMMERYKEVLEIKEDAEWKAIEPLVQKVMEARMATYSFRGSFGRGPSSSSSRDSGGSSSRPSFGGGSIPEADTLQKAVDSKASNAELKEAIAKYNEARKQKMANLEKAQDELRGVLSVRQEALATLGGLL